MALVLLLLSSTPFSSSGQDEGIAIGILPPPVYPADGVEDYAPPANAHSDGGLNSPQNRGRATGESSEKQLASGLSDRVLAPDEPSPPPGGPPTPTSKGVFLPCGGANAAEVARLRLRVHLPPVPAYPESGEIPEKLQHRLQFLDEEKGELIVSFPENQRRFWELDPGQEIQGNRVVERVPLRIAACPSLNVAIYQPGDSRTRGHVYRYKLHNRLQARQAISRLRIPLRLDREAMPVFGLVRPHGWGVDDSDGPRGSVEERLGDLSYSWGDAYREQLRPSLLRRRLNWYSKLTKYRLASGASMEPFGFTTPAQPGIVRAYIQGSWKGFGHAANWPWELKHQIGTFYDENNSLSISTIGPKFPPDADRRWIASDFLDSLDELIQTGELPGESAFLQELLRRLQTVAEGDGGAVDPAFWPSKPETDFQAEILMAVRLSLGD